MLWKRISRSTPLRGNERGPRSAPTLQRRSTNSSRVTTLTGWYTASAARSGLQEVQRLRVHQPAVGLHHTAVLARERGGERAGLGQHVDLGHRVVDDAGRERLDAAVAAAGDDRLVRGLLREPRLDERGHAGVERQAEGGLGGAEEGAARPHPAEGPSEPQDRTPPASL